MFPLDSSRKLSVSCFITVIEKEPKTQKCIASFLLTSLRLQISSVHIKYNVVLDADVKDFCGWVFCEVN